MATFGSYIHPLGGYTVQGRWIDPDGLYRWHDLKSFGYHQGDSRFFQLFDAPRYPLDKLRLMAKNFKPTLIFRMIKSEVYHIDHDFDSI